jgi:hypothetical protein
MAFSEFLQGSFIAFCGLKRSPLRFLELSLSPDLLSRASLLLALSLPWPLTAGVCPPGQVQVCLYGCLCVPDYPVLREQALELAAVNLQAWIEHSREQLLPGSEPIPPALREQLLTWYPPELLDSVRYRIGGSEQLDASALLSNPDVQAVTLVDLILFRQAEAATSDVALWAHELHHVQQYREWGTAGFARRYTRDFQAVEQPAYRVQQEVARQLREE